MSVKQLLGRFLPEPAKNAAYRANDCYRQLKADYYLRAASKRKKTGDKIRVGFIVQVPEIWDKEAPIYEAMVEDERFEPQLIVIPPYDQITCAVSKSYDNNYFINQYLCSIQALKNGKWLSLKKGQFDYIFLQRPYDRYLPKEFRSSKIVKISKLCYIPYGYSGSDVFNSLNTKKAFFRNVYFAFLESEQMVSLLKNQFSTEENRLHKFLFLGYPALQPYFSFCEKKEINSILWTPRWSCDSVLGGSNFLQYKDIFIDLAKKNPNISFTFRPHQLMFGELQKKGLMSKQEIDEYLAKIRANNIAYDNNMPIHNTLEKTDLLITDYSSLIIQFFLTGRPIIYCESIITLNNDYQRLKNGMYVVNSEAELKNAVEKLTNGYDPLKSKRTELIEKNYDIHKEATSRILEAINDDYKSINQNYQVPSDGPKRR